MLVPAIIGLLVLSVLSYLSARDLLISQMRQLSMNRRKTLSKPDRNTSRSSFESFALTFFVHACRS